jgi:hypothetical protein
MTNPCCFICGKMLFPDDPFAGSDDWYICMNPKCTLYQHKMRFNTKESKNSLIQMPSWLKSKHYIKKQKV